MMTRPVTADNKLVQVVRCTYIIALKPICSKHLFHYPKIFQVARYWHCPLYRSQWAPPPVHTGLCCHTARWEVAEKVAPPFITQSPGNWGDMGTHQPNCQPSNINYQSVSKRLQIVCVLTMLLVPCPDLDLPWDLPPAHQHVTKARTHISAAIFLPAHRF